ncbi:MAG: T9SS type A sorting domain-containing protein [Bacteroidetes bacterium]|nr:T9SS type A sorting domain-containing protein [Bacteroidota bacterium]
MKNKIFTLALRSISSPLDNRRLRAKLTGVGLLLLCQFCFWQQAFAQPNTATIATTTIVAAADICAGSTKVPIHAFSITTSGGTPGNAFFRGFNYTTTGTYLAIDINNFKLWVNTVNNLSTATLCPGVPGGTNTSPAGPGTQYFSYTNLALIAYNTTRYFWITMDVAASAIEGSTIAVNASVATDMSVLLNITTFLGTASASGTQTLKAQPAITAQPVAQATCDAYTTAFSVTAAGSGLTYQWKENGVSITDGGIYNGATTATLTLTGVTTGMTGYLYTCVITNAAACPVTSSSAALTVTAIPFAYSGSSVTQNNTSNVLRGTNYNEIIAIPIVMSGNCTPFNATSFSLNTTGSTAPATDITTASLWYTGASPLFATTSLFGTLASPSGAFTITGTQSLAPGINYFWLTYDVPATATVTDVLDGECTSVIVGGTAYAPTVTAPAGSRSIVAVNNWLWAKGAVGPGGATTLHDFFDCATDPLNNVYVTGEFMGVITFGSLPTLTSAGVTNTDVVVTKYDASGNALWARKGGSNGNRADRGWHVATDAAGNVFVTGITGFGGTFGSLTFQAGMFLVKYNTNGTEQWVKTGTTGDDRSQGLSVATDASGNIYVAGNFWSPTFTIGTYTLTNSMGAANQSDAFVVKYDALGTVLWVRKGASGNGSTSAYSVSVDGSGNVFVGGYTIHNTFVSGAFGVAFGAYSLAQVQTDDFFLVKYDANGNEQWLKGPTAGAGGGGGGNRNHIYGVKADAAGNVYITGEFVSNLKIGTTALTTAGFGNVDMFLAKYDASGAVQWAVKGGGTSTDRGYDIDINPLNGHLFVVGDAGVWTSTSNFTFGAVTVTGGNESLFIVEYLATNGTAVCGSALPGGAEDKSGVAADSWGYAYVGGDFEAIDPFVVGSTSIASSAGETGYVAKWSTCVAIPLPVEMMSFTAVCSDGKAKLAWSTASESNNDYFTVERSKEAAGGSSSLQWEQIGTVKGIGNSSTTTEYTFVDEQLLSPVGEGQGVRYYRLKQTDYNGSSNYSNIVSFNKNNCSMSVYPNPFDKTIYVSSGTAVNALFRIVNVLGQEVCARNIIIPGDGTSLAIDLPSLASGMYIVRISDTDNSTLLMSTKVVRAGVGD